MAGVAGLVFLLTRSTTTGDVWRITSTAIYGGTMILLFLMSSLYHAFRRPRVKHVFRLLDHSAIFLLIAGTYTPFILISARGAVGWTIFILVWSLAVAGILFELFFLDRFKWLTVTIYVSLGWIGVFGAKTMMQALSAPALWWILAGGLVYTTGVVFYKWKKLPYNHAIWHAFVVGGAACHWVSIYAFVLPVGNA